MTRPEGGNVSIRDAIQDVLARVNPTVRRVDLLPGADGGAYQVRLELSDGGAVWLRLRCRAVDQVLSGSRPVHLLGHFLAMALEARHARATRALCQARATAEAEVLVEAGTAA
jgi:hypothetical protein